ncbi:MAG: ATP-dependent DNA helicase RecG [Candidatus Gracilibacteria bacterium]|nr:ATP-dependent DNA helicase RecG [Candidatus Gracilibacteria bacterium]MDD2908619.1 ATP-dependent DNA helicase RecG [Candidatus Gracilibacteria bacterium]
MQLDKKLLHTTDSYIKKLTDAGVLTVEDLIEHYPRTYENKSNVLENFSYVNIQEKNSVACEIETIISEKTKFGKNLIKAIIKDKSGFLCEAVWFNQKYLLNQYKAGDKILIFGKPKYSYGKLSFLSPDIEFYSSQNKTIKPIYPEVNYIGSEWFEKKIADLKIYFKDVKNSLPEEIRLKKGFLNKAENLFKIHFPKNEKDFEEARRELAYEELYRMQYEGLLRKKELEGITSGKAPKIPMNSDLIKEIISKLPYSLTNSQKIVIFQILKDMEREFSMKRLLQGDVGTGKTIVVLIIAIHAILEKNIQVAFMVPTEILARQHFETIQKLLFEYNIKSDLLVGSLTPKQKEEAKARLKTGETQIIIGTHALIQEDVIFKNLGFVIIDEQHRFGVEQRKVLENYFSKNNELKKCHSGNLEDCPESPAYKGDSIDLIIEDLQGKTLIKGRFLPPQEGQKDIGGIFPHILNMTATPIPRTLALTIYGDQDISTISEYPAGRKPIYTKVIKETEREQMYNFIEQELKSGRQTYWVSPLVTESETLDIANATQMKENLSYIFPDYNIGLIHGKMKAKEKDAVMEEFMQNKVKVLSSTSVIEVGVDNQNATIICIEAAERFGLSQLHQFRGRVGRGEHQSYCYLFTTKEYKGDRLKAMEKTNDGFELSEIDLELRGPGEVYGVRQSGIPEFKIANLKDFELISEIREDIEKMLGGDKK